jgi:hypothetical protein
MEVLEVCVAGCVLMMNQWNAVALWAWDIVVDNCAICRNHIMDLCTYVESHLRRKVH